jgi:hypothetical protein
VGLQQQAVSPPAQRTQSVDLSRVLQPRFSTQASPSSTQATSPRLFCYVYIPAEKYFHEHKLTLPLGFGSNFDATLNDSWRLGPYEMLPTKDKIVVNIRGEFDLSASFSLKGNGLSTIAPSEANRPFHFTYKEMAMAAEGEFNFEGRRQRFSGECGILDYTKGYPPRRTEWNWLSMVGKTESGKSLSVNLGRQV